MAVGVLIWGFLWIIHRSEIAGKKSTIETLKAQLESQKSTLNERLNLAVDKAAIADRAKDDLEKQVQTLRMDLAAATAKAENGSLAKVEAQLQRVEAGLAKLGTANNAVSSTLSAAFKVTEAPDVANFDTSSQDFLLYAASRNLDALTRKQLQDDSSPFINIGTKK